MSFFSDGDINQVETILPKRTTDTKERKHKMQTSSLFKMLLLIFTETYTLTGH